LPLILAIDCSDRACSVALGGRPENSVDLGGDLIERYTDEARQHAKQLLPMYREIVSESSYRAEDIDAVAIAAGPGSFTGLRIGFSFAQGIAFALNKPLIKISSLEAMAFSRVLEAELPTETENIHVCVDARMGELYYARFQVVQSTDVELLRQQEDSLIAIEDFDLLAAYSKSVMLGTGLEVAQLSAVQALEQK